MKTYKGKCMTKQEQEQEKRYDLLFGGKNWVGQVVWFGKFAEILSKKYMYFSLVKYWRTHIVQEVSKCE